MRAGVLNSEPAGAGHVEGDGLDGGALRGRELLEEAQRVALLRPWPIHTMRPVSMSSTLVRYRWPLWTLISSTASSRRSS